MEDLGLEPVHGRRIRLFQLVDWSWVDPGVPPPFSLLVAARAERDDLNEKHMRRFADQAIAAGCGCVCTWGEECELVHDVFDQASLASHRLVMSSWHDQDSLAHVLYFTLVDAFPADHSLVSANAAVILAIEEPWVAEVRRLAKNQDELARLWAGDSND